MPLLELKDVAVRFPTPNDRRRQLTALEGVNLSVDTSEFIAIVGPSGCGKSTLLRLVDGLIAPSEGRVLLHGAPVSGPGPDRAVVFQQASLLPWRTVLRNVAFGLECLDVPRKEREERARQYIRLVGLEGFEEYFPGQLSGGMQQRVGLARALAVEPEVMLLDEPFGALDAQTRVQMQLELARIWSTEKRTTILITHDIDEAIFLADRVYVMSRSPGRIVEVIQIPFPQPRTDAVRLDPRFAQLHARMWDLLAAPQQPGSRSGS